MLYLALGAAVLVAVLWATRTPSVRFGGGWKAITGLVALAAVTGAILSLLRGAWGVGALLLALGLGLAGSLRTAPRGSRPAGEGRSTSRMTRAEAAELLGISLDASRDEVQAAYVRLMRMAHPDTGGTHGLAAKLNEARETLLGSG